MVVSSAKLMFEIKPARQGMASATGGEPAPLFYGGVQISDITDRHKIND